MSQRILYIGNKNYSSWSLRPWMLLRHLQIAFEERVVPLQTPQFTAQMAALGGAGRVPVLVEGDLTVWDSLAICEYAMELATGRGLPEAAPARAVARAVSAEMHSGFQTLRQTWPMNARAAGRSTRTPPALEQDLRRIDELWTNCRQQYGGHGDWLFGEYSLADAMYAPVVLRFATYGAEVGATSRAYMHTALADPVLKEWIAAARTETWTIADGETGTVN